MADLTPTAPEYVLEVNGVEEHVEGSWLGESLLDVLRDRLGWPGTKNACNEGECGSCTVLVDEVAVCSCCVLAADAQGASITTVEGLAPRGQVGDVQQAFLDAGAVQCGFCTPGLVVAAHDLLARRPGADADEIREALSGNLCRCTGYGRVLQAVADARDARAAASDGGGR